MNTLVEKMFGIIMFLAIFVPFQLGLYTSYMDAWEFTQVTSEVTQLVKEEGGVTGNAQKFVKTLRETKNSKGDYLYGYTITFKTPKLGPDGKAIYVDNSNPKDGVKETPVYDTLPEGVKQPMGKVINIDFKKNKETVYGWKPDLKKVTNVTVYKR